MLKRMNPTRLSGKLLIMTIGFVMLAELLLFIPSAALYRQSWLKDRTTQVDILNLALQGVPDFKASDALTNRVMTDTDIVMASERHDGMSQILFGAPPDSTDFETIDIREFTRFPSFINMFKSYFAEPSGYYRLIDETTMPKNGTLEVIIPKSKLRWALRDYGKRIFALSLFIAFITGGMIYLSMVALIIRPVGSLVRNIALFQADPETRLYQDKPNGRKDEIGDLERAFYDMKHSVRGNLKQKDRLATLGLAVAKINHDLRNILASTQLITDRLTMDKDPKIARIGNRLTRAVDRGITLTGDVLNYSTDTPSILKRENISLSFLIGEIAGDILPNFGMGPRKIKFINEIDSDLEGLGDPDHTYRIFHNLIRNAAQAMASINDDNAKRELRVYAKENKDKIDVFVEDSAGGLPPKVMNNLFKAFSASGKGTGLGLSIAKELSVEQGGELSLKRSGPSGTVFIVQLPPAEHLL